MAEANSTSAVDLQDQIHEALEAASAIVDCVRVLASLERSQSIPKEHRNGALALGNGFAGGSTVRDASLPDALFHAMGLIDRAKELSDQAAKVQP